MRERRGQRRYGQGLQLAYGVAASLPCVRATGGLGHVQGHHFSLSNVYQPLRGQRWVNVLRPQ